MVSANFDNDDIFEHFQRDRRRQPQIITQGCDSDDEFYDALENTQALNEHQERVMLNSPTLQKLDRLYNNQKSGATWQDSPQLD